MTRQSTLGPLGLVTGCLRDAQSAWPQALRPQSREPPLPYPQVFTGTCSKQVRKAVIFYIEKGTFFYHQKCISLRFIYVGVIPTFLT